MSVSSVTTFGSAAIASPPTNDPNNVRRDDKPADASSAQITQAAKPPGTGQFVDMTA